MIGRIAGASRDWKTGKCHITIETEHLPPEFDALAGYDAIDITMCKHRVRRSLDANAYFHVLCTRIAEKLKQTVTEAKNDLIAEWGQPDQDIRTVILDDGIDWRKVEPLHLRPTKAVRMLDNGRLYRVYIVMRGSHTYDTKEMSRLIDGAVETARELGIETLTPDQLARMKATWRNR